MPTVPVGVETDVPRDIPGSLTDTGDRALMRKVGLRLIPFLFLLYIIAYLDRVNVGFAKLQMNSLPWFSETVFGTGAGVFFLGYALFEVPSNLILAKVGARVWIMRIMISWGLVAMAMIFAQGKISFYLLRFLLGLAEAGFFPGVLLYMTFWFTAKERARVVALFMTANAVSYIFGGPLSGFILSRTIIPSLSHWQQLFVLEALPAIVLGFVVLWYLPDGPENARWLTPSERSIIQARVRQERGASTESMAHPPLWTALSQRTVLLLCLLHFFLVCGMYGISMWLPQIIKGLGKPTDLQVGLLTAIPYLAAGIVMVANAVHSDRTGERRLHIVIPATCGAIGLVGCALFNQQPILSLAALSLAAAGMWATLGPFWSLAPQVLRGPAALAGGIALVNALGNLGGYLGPFAVGYVKDATHDFKASLFVLAGSITCAAVLAFIIAAPGFLTPRVRDDRADA